MENDNFDPEKTKTDNIMKEKKEEKEEKIEQEEREEEQEEKEEKEEEIEEEQEENSSNKSSITPSSPSSLLSTNSFKSNNTLKVINKTSHESIVNMEEKKRANNKISIEKENEILRRELSILKNNSIYSDKINKIQLELNYEKKMIQIKDDDNISKMYMELESGKRKNELRRQSGLIGIEDTIKLYPLTTYTKYCCNLISWYKNRNIIEDFDKIYEIITQLPSINNYEKNLILLRFSNIQSYCSRKYNRISKLYNLSQIFLIACSIINPALLSVNIDGTNPYYNIFFWTVWILQLFVSLVTGYISLFKWDKKNFLFNIYKTKINQEIWFFIGLTGKNYTNIDGNYNHSDYVNLFLNRLEKIYTMLKTTEFEMENSKDYETNTNPNPNGNYNNIKQYDILQSRVAQSR